MLDAVDAEARDAVDGLVEGGVGRDGEPVPVRLVDDRVQLLVGELEGVVARHDLDEVRAAADLLADGPAHLVGAARLAADPVRVPPRLDDRRAADLQARAREDTLLDGLLREEVHVVEAEVADHGDPGAQALEHVAGRLEGRDRTGVVHRLARQVVDPVPVEMRVTVDEARHQGAVGLLDRRRRGLGLSCGARLEVGP